MAQDECQAIPTALVVLLTLLKAPNASVIIIEDSSVHVYSEVSPAMASRNRAGDGGKLRSLFAVV